jgi:hypothetical protein
MEKMFYKITSLFCFCLSINVANAQDNSNQNYYDTLSIETIDTSVAKEFVSYYEATEITRLNETIINVNDILKISELTIGTKYNFTLKFANTYNYDLIINKGIMKPTSSCGCINIIYNNTNLTSGAELQMFVEILPLVAGDKNDVIELPIIKRSLIEANPPTIVGIKQFKLIFKVKQ